MITREQYNACVQFLACPTNFSGCDSTIREMAISRFNWTIYDEDLIRMCRDKIEEYDKQQEDIIKNLEDHLADVKCRLRRIEEHLGLED